MSAFIIKVFPDHRAEADSWVHPEELKAVSLCDPRYELGKLVLITCLGDNTASLVYEREVSTDIIRHDAKSQYEDFIGELVAEEPTAHLSPGAIHVSKVGGDIEDYYGLIIQHFQSATSN